MTNQDRLNLLMVGNRAMGTKPANLPIFWLNIIRKSGVDRKMLGIGDIAWMITRLTGSNVGYWHRKH